MSTPIQKSYGEILKSTVLVGGATVLVVAVGVLRTKAMAVMLGPAGFGLFGLFSAIVDLAVAIAGMGINSSGVRQIAAATGTGDSGQVAKTARMLRLTAVALGLLGAAGLIVARDAIALATFGDVSYAPLVAVLSVAVLLRMLTAGQTALLQGLRRIADMARMNVVGSLAGAIAAIAVVYVMREDGVVVALVAMALATLLVSWWYARKVEIAPVTLSVGDIGEQAAGLLKLGLAFMASGVLMMGAAYAVRAMIARDVGLEAAGFYSAAWTLGGLYAGIILQAMGADFYPRLVAAAENDADCNRLVNEQALVSLLLAAPGVIATIVLAPLIIRIFYTAEFGGAVEILRWIALGIALRIVSWPIGYIIVAKNRQTAFFLTELAWTIAYVGMAVLFVRHWGAEGAGIAFFLSYVFHAGMIYVVVARLSGFRWSPTSLKAILLYVIAVASAFAATKLLAPTAGLAAGCVVLAVAAVVSLKALVSLVPFEQLPQPARGILKKLGLGPGPQAGGQ